MRKFAYICLAITIASLLFLVGWSRHHSLQGENTIYYWRFHTVDENGITKFNWNGIHSPVQVESRRVLIDTLNVINKVIYPYGEKFKMIPPDTDADIMVAGEMGKAIKESISKIVIKNNLDYDGTSLGVRRYENPSIPRLAVVDVYNKITGTASPDAKKYGFKNSIMPGHLEDENLKLSEERLDRTSSILEGMGFRINEKVFMELQFADTLSALEAIVDPSILESMRYVEVKTKVTYQRLEVKTMTAPIAIPFWLGLIALGLSLLVPLFKKSVKVKSRKPDYISPEEDETEGSYWPNFHHWDEWDGAKIMFAFAFIFILIVFGFLLCIWGIVVLVFPAIAAVVYLVIFIYKHTGRLIKTALIQIRMTWHVFLIWWRYLPDCCKILLFVVPFLIAIIILLFGYIFVCPCI